MRSAGFTAEVFSSAEEILGSGRIHGASCLILDIRMPGMSGIELQDRLIASGRAVPIIFITAHADDAERARAIERGAIECLQKPFSEDALLDAISTRSSRSSTAIGRRSGLAADLVPGFEGPIDEELRVMPRALKAARGPVQFTAWTEPPPPKVLAERFAFRSMLGLAVFPHVPDPTRFHHFTLAQTTERVWTPHEMRLFHEIGRRPDDAVSSPATLRTLRESESAGRSSRRTAAG